MSRSAPLRGLRIVVTRHGEQADDFCRALRAQGAEPLRFPTIDFAPLTTSLPPDAGRNPDRYRWVIFTSPNAVRFFPADMAEAIRNSACRIAAVGVVTAAAAEARGWHVDFVPADFSGRTLAAMLPGAAGARILIPRSEQGRPELTAGLTTRGASVDDVATYRTVIGRPTAEQFAALAQGVDFLTFTSPLTVMNFAKLAETKPDAAVACIGPTTADEAARQGYPPDIVANPYTIEGLIQGMIDYVAS